MPQRKQILQALLQGGLGFLQGNALGDLLKDKPDAEGFSPDFSAVHDQPSDPSLPIGTDFGIPPLPTSVPKIPQQGTAQGFQGPGFGGAGFQLPPGLLSLLKQRLGQ